MHVGITEIHYLLSGTQNLLLSGAYLTTYHVTNISPLDMYTCAYQHWWQICNASPHNVLGNICTTYCTTQQLQVLLCDAAVTVTTTMMMNMTGKWSSAWSDHGGSCTIGKLSRVELATVALHMSARLAHKYLATVTQRWQIRLWVLASWPWLAFYFFGATFILFWRHNLLQESVCEFVYMFMYVDIRIHTCTCKLTSTLAVIMSFPRKECVCVCVPKYVCRHKHKHTSTHWFTHTNWRDQFIFSCTHTYTCIFFIQRHLYTWVCMHILCHIIHSTHEKKMNTRLCQSYFSWTFMQRWMYHACVHHQVCGPPLLFAQAYHQVCAPPPVFAHVSYIRYHFVPTNHPVTTCWACIHTQRTHRLRDWPYTWVGYVTEHTRWLAPSTTYREK
jgi:hypothetical protein